MRKRGAVRCLRNRPKRPPANVRRWPSRRRKRSVLPARGWRRKPNGPPPLPGNFPKPATALPPNGRRSRGGWTVLPKMLPAIALACLLFPTRFTSTERCSAPQTLLMGATFVTEGALPFALRDPLRVSLACIAGSALAGFITILLGCGCPAPHGGLFLLPVMENPPGFLIALAVGTLTTALLLGMLKKPLKH